MDKNIFFFLIPKSQVEYLNEDDTVRQALEKMEYHKYSCIPVLSSDGKYLRSISDGDLLRYIKQKRLSLAKSENTNIMLVPIIKDVKSIPIYKNIDDLLDLIINQNFAPVLDDSGIFIGIITRKSVIEYLKKELNK